MSQQEEDVQPIQRSGMVRAFSHLPQRAQGEPAAPRLTAPTYLPSWATEPPETEHEPEAEADTDRHGDHSRSDTPGTPYAGTPPETSVRDEADGQRSDSWDDRPPPTRPDSTTSAMGRGFDGRSTPVAFFPQQGLGASGPSSQQRLQGSQRAIAALQQQARASNPPAQGGRPGAQSQASVQPP